MQYCYSTENRPCIDNIDIQAEKQGKAVKYMAKNRINHIRKTHYKNFIKTKHINKQ